MIEFRSEDPKLKKNISKGAKLFFDMDNVLVDFKSGINKLSEKIISKYEWKDLDEVPGIFGKMEPMNGAVEAVKKIK